jgi:hypothetical protein
MSLSSSDIDMTKDKVVYLLYQACRCILKILLEFLEGGPDLVSRRQMSDSLKLTQLEAREQSVASFIVRIMKLHLNWSDSFTCSIERNNEPNFPNSIPNNLENTDM